MGTSSADRDHRQGQTLEESRSESHGQNLQEPLGTREGQALVGRGCPAWGEVGRGPLGQETVGEGALPEPERKPGLACRQEWAGRGEGLVEEEPVGHSSASGCEGCFAGRETMGGVRAVPSQTILGLPGWRRAHLLHLQDPLQIPLQALHRRRSCRRVQQLQVVEIDMAEDEMRPMRPRGWYRGPQQTTVDDTPNGPRTCQDGHAKSPRVGRDESAKSLRVDREQSARVDQEQSVRVDQEQSAQVERDENAKAGKLVEREV